MKKVILLIALAIFLLGCENSMKAARAREVRARTDRANDKHALAMAEWGAMTSTRLAAKKKLIFVSASAGIILIAITIISGSYYIVGFFIAKVKQANLMLIPLDRHTRQYPVIISNGQRAYNPNTLASSPFAVDSLPHPQLVDSSTTILIGEGPRYNSYKEYKEDQKLLLG